MSSGVGIGLMSKSVVCGKGEMVIVSCVDRSDLHPVTSRTNRSIPTMALEDNLSNIATLFLLRLSTTETSEVIPSSGLDCLD